MPTVSAHFRSLRGVQYRDSNVHDVVQSVRAVLTCNSGGGISAGGVLTGHLRRAVQCDPVGRARRDGSGQLVSKYSVRGVRRREGRCNCWVYLRDGDCMRRRPRVQRNVIITAKVHRETRTIEQVCVRRTRRARRCTDRGPRPPGRHSPAYPWIPE